MKDRAPPVPNASIGAVPAAGDRALVFRRGGSVFCLSLESVAEVQRGVTVEQAPGPGGVIGFIALRSRFLTAVDPLAAIGLMPAYPGSAGALVEVEAEGTSAVIVETGAGHLALIADRVLGLRRLERIAGAQWLGAGFGGAGTGLVAASATVEEMGHAYVLSAAALGHYPAVPAETEAMAADGAEMQAAAPAGEGEMFLTFRIGHDLFAAAFADIERILHERRLWPLPGGRVPIRSVVESGGAVVPVYDLDPGPAPETATCIVLRSEVGPVALRVDGVERPERLNRDGPDDWFTGGGITGLARNGRLAFRVVDGPALLAAGNRGHQAALPGTVGAGAAGAKAAGAKAAGAGAVAADAGGAP
ncbi:MAG: hypothetical protein RLY86_1654 [Pseudomonadota bacterium]|jgi:chemotaxis signal transduction protein